MKYSLDDKRVTLMGSGHFIAPNATLIGDVTLQENASVWFNCVLRGDADHIEIGAGSNIQDGSVLHVDPGFPLTVGANVTVVGGGMMMFGEIVGLVEGALSPDDVELALADVIADPIKTHVDGFGSFLFDGVSGDAFGGAVVGLHGCFALWMIKFIEGSANGFGVLAGIE